jgi:signal transduction histidine kinase
MDSDHFSIKNEIKYVRSTKVFKNFVIYGARKDPVAYIKQPSLGERLALHPIKDQSNIVWGYYSYEKNYRMLINTFLMLVFLTFLFLGLFFFILKRIISKRVTAEFTPFYGYIDKLKAFSNELNKLEVGQSIQYQPLLRNEHTSYEEGVINENFSKLITEIIRSRDNLEEVIVEAESRKMEAQLSKLAIQIAHDIRSPIAALQNIILVLKELPVEQLNLISSVSKRIEDIANSILKNAKQLAKEPKLEECELTSLLSNLCQEKQVEYQQFDGIEISYTNRAKDLPIYACVNENKMSRVLSNIINNAYDAIEDTGVINVSLDCTKDTGIEISIADTGNGISNEMLSKLLKDKVKSNKAGGSGIGLLTAREAIESWHGKISIKTELEKGTTVLINIPLAKTPVWHLDRVSISEEQTVIVIDDDVEIHNIWNHVLSNLQASINVENFFDAQSFSNWVDKNGHPSNSIYFVDFNLVNSEQNGIDLIQESKIESSAVLVTSLYDDSAIRQLCSQLNIKLLPKHRITSIPILYESDSLVV